MTRVMTLNQCSVKVKTPIIPADVTVGENLGKVFRLQTFLDDPKITKAMKHY